MLRRSSDGSTPRKKSDVMSIGGFWQEDIIDGIVYWVDCTSGNKVSSRRKRQIPLYVVRGSAVRRDQSLASLGDACSILSPHIPPVLLCFLHLSGFDNI